MTKQTRRYLPVSTNA